MKNPNKEQLLRRRLKMTLTNKQPLMRCGNNIQIRERNSVKGTGKTFLIRTTKSVISSVETQTSR